MVKTLRCFTCFAWTILLTFSISLSDISSCSGQNHAGIAAPALPASGDRLVHDVLTQLEARERIAANVLLQAELGGRVVQLGGRYLQLRDHNSDSLLVRLQLQGEVAGTPVAFLQVSDGKRLWIDRQTPTGRKVARVDLRKVRRQIDAATAELDGLSAGEARGRLVRAELSAEYGGLPKLIAGLAENFQFSAPVSLRLSGVLAWAAVGTWRPAALAEIHTLEKAEDGTPLRLPPRIPTSVLLLVGQDDSFPYVLEFRQGEELPLPSVQDVSQVQFSANPLMLLRLYERDFESPIYASEFDYLPPGDLEAVDLTDSRLERLELAKQRRLASLRARRH